MNMRTAEDTARAGLAKQSRIAGHAGGVIEFYKSPKGYAIVYAGLDYFDMTSPTACHWIVPGTIEEGA